MKAKKSMPADPFVNVYGLSMIAGKAIAGVFLQCMAEDPQFAGDVVIDRRPVSAPVSAYAIASKNLFVIVNCSDAAISNEVGRRNFRRYDANSDGDSHRMLLPGFKDRQLSIWGHGKRAYQDDFGLESAPRGKFPKTVDETAAPKPDPKH